jgi:hypothetical protein
MTPKIKEYDVAISFLNRDEALARSIADQLLPLKVFVYSKQQEALAGKNGIEEFRETFRNRTRTALVLHRAGWGATPFTRIEEVAIQELCMAEGWELLMVVSLESSSTPPKWVPLAHIRFDLETFPIAQLIGAIKSKVISVGGVVRAPTAAEVAKQLADQEAFDQDTERLLSTGSQPFHDAATALFSALEEQIADIQRESGWTIVHGHDNSTFVAFLDRVSMQLLPQELYLNSARKGHFVVRRFHGRLLTPAERSRGMMVMGGDATEIGRQKLLLKRQAGLGWIWSYRDRTASASEIVRMLLTEFLADRTHAMRSN